MLTPVIILNSSPATCGAVPMPADATVILPGLALARAINSATVVAGTDGCASNTNGYQASPATGAISRLKLKLSFSYNEVLIAFAEVTRRSVEPSGGELSTAWTEILVPPAGFFWMMPG